jgi:hypothetical protein
MRSVSDLIARVRAEYMEMPGLALTPGQVERLCGIEQTTCRIVLDTLIAAGFLCVKADGRYARLTEGRSIVRSHAVASVHLLTDSRTRKAS